jgi:hypothetical protein
MKICVQCDYDSAFITPVIENFSIAGGGQAAVSDVNRFDANFTKMTYG